MPVTWRGPEILQKARQAALRGVVRGTEAVLETAVDSILHGEKTGRIYHQRKLTKAGVPYKRPVFVEHQASAPGEPPASDTGRLVQSGRTSYSLLALAGKVTFSTEYARKLELGDDRVAERPFLRPALAKNKQLIKDAISEEIAAELKGFSK